MVMVRVRTRTRARARVSSRIRVKVRARARPRAWGRGRVSSPTSKSTGTQPASIASLMRSDQRACPGGARQKGDVDSSRQYSAALSLCAPPCCSRIVRSSW